MKMKGIALLVLAALLLAGCSGRADEPAMYIRPAELSEEEEAVARLLGADTEQHLFDVALDGTAKTVSICAYELMDGKWESFSGGGGMALEEGEKKGRMAFGFTDLRGDMRQAVQFGKNFSAVSWGGPEEETAAAGMSQTTAFLSNPTEIVYGQEIPIAVQINTAKNEVSSYDPEYFFQPERYAEKGYEHVYALTVTFSQEPLS